MSLTLSIFGVTKFDKFKNLNNEQPKNIASIVVTCEVSQLVKSIVPNLKHLWNKACIFWTEEVFSFPKFKLLKL